MQEIQISVILWHAMKQNLIFFKDVSTFNENQGLEEGKYEQWPDISKCFYSFETDVKIHLTIILKEFLS